MEVLSGKIISLDWLVEAQVIVVMSFQGGQGERSRASARPSERRFQNLNLKLRYLQTQLLENRK